jgi:hypothetical protein
MVRDFRTPRLETLLGGIDERVGGDAVIIVITGCIELQL